ncbi:MAG: hypothetical protein WCF85_00570 [Rhodospirillaceae bacterium]
MDAAILIFAWFWTGQAPAGMQVPFPSMASCQEARQNLFDDRKRALGEAGGAGHRVPQLSATCVAAAPPAVLPALKASEPASQPSPVATPPAAAPAQQPVTPAGLEWLVSRPVNLLDWGLQKAVNTIEAVHAIKVIYQVNGAAAEDFVNVDFSLSEAGHLKYTIQGAVTARLPEMVNETYCIAAVKAWREAVLKINGDNPLASIEDWFIRADRNPAERPPNLAESIAAGFDFKMTINGLGQQPGLSCQTAFVEEPTAPAK